MSVNICLDDNLLDVVIDALTKKMGSINTLSILSKSKTEKMEREYKCCEKALDVMLAAKDSINAANVMAMEKS